MKLFLLVIGDICGESEMPNTPAIAFTLRVYESLGQRHRQDSWRRLGSYEPVLWYMMYGVLTNHFPS